MRSGSDVVGAATIAARRRIGEQLQRERAAQHVRRDTGPSYCEL